jgi:hypothetical protein
MVENDIKAHLPIGSSKADVIAYLDRRKIPHGWFQKGEVAPKGQIVIPDRHIKTDIIRDVRTEGSLFKIIVAFK